MQAIDLLAIPADGVPLQLSDELFPTRLWPQQPNVADRTSGETFQHRKVAEEVMTHDQDQRIVFDKRQRLFCGQESVCQLLQLCGSSYRGSVARYGDFPTQAFGLLRYRQCVAAGAENKKVRRNRYKLAPDLEFCAIREPASRDE